MRHPASISSIKNKGAPSELVLKDYQGQKVAMEKAKVTRFNGAKTSIGYLASTIKIGSSGAIKTTTDYENYWSEHVSGIGTGMATLIVDYAGLAPLVKQAAKHWNQDNKPKTNEEVPAAVTATVELDKAMAAQLKAKQELSGRTRCVSHVPAHRCCFRAAPRTCRWFTISISRGRFQTTCRNSR